MSDSLQRTRDRRRRTRRRAWISAAAVGLAALLCIQIVMHCGSADDASKKAPLRVRVDPTLRSERAMAVGSKQASPDEGFDSVDVTLHPLTERLVDVEVVRYRGEYAERLVLRVASAEGALGVTNVGFGTVELASGMKWTATDVRADVALSRGNGMVCDDSPDSLLLDYAVTGSLAGSEVSQSGGLRLPWREGPR